MIQTKIVVGVAMLAKLAGATVFTYVPIPTSDNIQTNLINTFPTGAFVSNNVLATPFSIPSAAGTCGNTAKAPCNFYDGFGFSGSGKSITMNVSIQSPTDAYSLMNAYQPPAGRQLATITFTGTGGATATFSLVGGQNIRDFYQGNFTNNLTNGVTGVEAFNAFVCTAPANCRGGGATGNVQTGNSGNYVIDEQHFSLGSTFAGQTLTQITLTDTNNGSDPILLAMTVGSAGAGTPVITSGGVVPIYSPATTVQPGSWISIFGANLAPAVAIWNGDFPTSLGGTTVTIDNKAAYLWYVSPTQINLQAPDDSFIGSVTVLVTTASGSTTSTVTLGEVGPSFSLLDGKHVAGIILRSDGSGAYGGGTYDIVGPTGTSLGYKTVAAKPGDILELFGVGFGPTTPIVPAGQVYTNSALTTNPVQLKVNNIAVMPSFAGLTSAGLYQINVIQLPSGLGSGDVPLLATGDGVQTPTGVVLSLQ